MCSGIAADRNSGFAVSALTTRWPSARDTSAPGGASAEGGPEGAYNEMMALNGIVSTAAMTVIVTGMWLFLEKTSYGLVIRAGARDSEIVRVLGIDISRVWMVVFGIGTGAAGIAGYLSAPMQSVIPEMGIPVLVQAFVVTVVGGMGSLVGAVIAGLLVGVVTSITVMIAPQLADAAMFG